MLVVGSQPKESSSSPLIAAPDTKTFNEIRKRGCLRVIVNSYTPQLAFRESENEPIVGLEIDLVSQLGAAIFGSTFDAAKHLELIEPPNAIKLDLLTEHEVDLIVANLTDTPQRRRRIDMCGHYFSVREAPLLGPNVPNVSNIAELENMTVAVEAETSTVDMVARVAPHANVVELQSPSEWIDALETGRAQLFIGDTLYNSIISRGSDLAEGSLRFEASHAAIGVAKGQEDLRAFINIYIAEMLANGHLMALHKRWKLA